MGCAHVVTTGDGKIYDLWRVESHQWCTQHVLRRHHQWINTTGRLRAQGAIFTKFGKNALCGQKILVTPTSYPLDIFALQLSFCMFFPCKFSFPFVLLRICVLLLYTLVLPSIVRWDTTKCHYWKGIPWSVQEVQLLCVGSSGSFSTEQEFHRVMNGNQESLYPCPPEFRLHCSSCPQIKTEWNKGGCWEPGQL